VRSLPDGEPLVRHGSAGQGGPIRDSLQEGYTLRFDLPPEDATGIELSLDDLVVFCTCGNKVVQVPAPSLDGPVDLAGISLGCGDDSADLIRWEPPNYSTATPRLFVRSPAKSWPDIRVLVGDRSVTLWMRPTIEGTLEGGLPGMYLSAFVGSDELSLGLRMLGHQLSVDPIGIGLTSAGDTDRS
jgi:hypothetical protein